MENNQNISNREIVEMTNSLLESFGNCQWLQSDTYLQLTDLYHLDKDLVGCIETIKGHFKFKNKLSVEYFRDSRPRYNADKTQVQKTAAVVLIFHDMPLYGTKAFAKMTIEILLNVDCTYKTLPPFLYIISHELSHIVLHCTKNVFRYSEIATDILAAIMIGPGLISVGRKQFFYSLGYIKDDHFEIARNIIYAKSKRFSLQKLKSMLWFFLNKRRLSE